MQVHNQPGPLSNLSRSTEGKSYNVLGEERSIVHRSSASGKSLVPISRTDSRGTTRENSIDYENISLNRARMLLKVSQKMAECETLDDILEKLVELITEMVEAERGTIFLKDAETNELYSRVSRGSSRGSYKHEIRIMADKGVAGHVFQTKEVANVPDAYQDERFDPSVDEKTGYRTKSILCVPIRTVSNDVIGAAQFLNKFGDRAFTHEDELLVQDVTRQAAVALKTTQVVEQVNKARDREKELLDVVADITSEIDLGKILQKVMSQATKMIASDRSTLFLNDEKTNELFSMVGEGLGTEIRLPNTAGIAGTVFTSGKSVNIPYAYSDLRFSPAFDKKTGYFTRSILCVPVNNKEGKTIGVIQLLNKLKGIFTDEDEQNLRTFTAQVSIALENAKLFDDVQKIKNRNEGMLQSMSSCVITLNEDGKIETCNKAGMNILNLSSEEDIIDQQTKSFFTGANAWILDKVKRVEETLTTEVTMDAELEVAEKRTETGAEPGNVTGKAKNETDKGEDEKPEIKMEKISANVTVLPLFSIEKKTAFIDKIDPEEMITEEKKKLGSMIIIEDISGEKRMKATMSRYMDPDVAEELLKGGDDVLGGRSTVATVLFSDIRGFTTLTEEFGPQGTVSFLNEYFTIMVDCIQREGGMLDKFIGDATMAAFGIPMPHEDDEDRGMRAAISMLTEMFEWNKGREAQGKKMIDMGVGLNTDMVVTGNIGSPKRMDYTMIGDGVNLASRLESACKQYFARILISENTFNKLKDQDKYSVREIDLVVVKGKNEAVAIYEVLDYHTEETFPNMTKVMTLFGEGLTEYRTAEWDKAIDAFTEALRLNPDDKLSNMYIERCNSLKKEPPEGEWKGVYVMKSK